MKRLLKLLGAGVGGIIGLALLAVVVLNSVSIARQRRIYRVPATGLDVPSDHASLRRGRHVVTALAACSSCHGPDLGGQVVLDQPLLGRFVAVNLTRGAGGLLRERTNQDLVRAIRHGVGRNGRPLLFMPSDAFQDMSDDDLAAAIAYLRTVTPVDRTLPSMRVGPLGRALHVLGVFPLLPAEKIDHDATGRAPSPGVTIAYGRYLATVAGCRGCHGPSLRGGSGPGPDLVAALASWTEADFRRALQKGKRPDGSALAEPMPWQSFAHMREAEIAALWRYVASLRSSPATVARR